MGEEPLETGGSELVRYWRILTAAFLVALFSGGMRFTIGPFVAPIVADFGITHSQLSAIVAAAMLVFGFSLPVLGRLVDAWGSRIVLLVGTVLVCASLLAMAWTRSPVVFALAFVVTSSLGFAATGPVTLSPLISRWFHRQRGLAMVFLSAGGMGGMALLTPVSAALIQAYGWRYTYMVFAAFTAAVLLPAILVWMKERKAR
ncbi:MAG: MFS transporter, partial [Symbiobacteriaceae bacterium]